MTTDAIVAPLPAAQPAGRPLTGAEIIERLYAAEGLVGMELSAEQVTALCQELTARFGRKRSEALLPLMMPCSIITLPLNVSPMLNQIMTLPVNWHEAFQWGVGLISAGYLLFLALRSLLRPYLTYTNPTTGASFRLYKAWYMKWKGWSLEQRREHLMQYFNWQDEQLQKAKRITAILNEPRAHA